MRERLKARAFADGPLPRRPPQSILSVKLQMSIQVYQLDSVYIAEKYHASLEIIPLLTFLRALALLGTLLCTLGRLRPAGSRSAQRLAFEVKYSLGFAPGETRFE
ncbi:hypothetical protein BV25DRAFT_223810 [Artomyces pyxidatus]|uniref:Uncharacterized protein n=1 Tax=Artomyces pyxidatus TaxID=48021 RepID=A0ACB8T800_9AGAM|nr:hypothetical protein BV25DRAFT_223810 [Artomyces pyxidatus]